MNPFERDDSPELDSELPDLPDLGHYLAPPPSPLGGDFAKRTAALVLKRANETSRREFLRPVSHSKFASFGKENPALTLFARETARNTLKPLQAAAVFLLYSMPAVWLYEMPSLGIRPASSILSNSEIYFYFLFASLCFAVPLYLFTQTYAFYSRLIQGRAIEEILLTHIRPAELVDSLLASSMRKVLPLIGLMTVSLLPTICLDHHWSFFAWPLQSLVICIFGCSLLQLYSLRQGENQSRRKVESIGLLCCFQVIVLAQWFPLHALWTGILMLAVAVHCRRQSILALSALQNLAQSPREFVEKKTAKAGRKPVGRLESWLRTKFADYPLVYRELGRSRLFSLARIAINPFSLMFFYLLPSALDRGLSGDPATIPLILLTALVAYFDASRLLMNEKSSGSFDLLVQGGLNTKDFVQNSFRLALLRLGPSIVLSLAWSCWLYWHTSQIGTRNQAFLPDSLGVALWGLGVILSLIVAAWCGTALGVRTSLESTQWRSNVGRLLMDSLLLVIGTSTFMSVFNIGLHNWGSHTGFDLLSTLLALRWLVSWRAPSRSGSNADCASWALLLLPAFPICLAWAGPKGLSLSTTGPFLLVAPWLLWSGAATRSVWNFRSSHQLARYFIWVLSYLVVCLSNTFLLYWFSQFYTSMYRSRVVEGELTLSESLVIGGGVLVWAVLLAAIFAGLSKPTPPPASTDAGFQRRSLWAAGMALVAGLIVGERFYQCVQLGYQAQQVGKIGWFRPMRKADGFLKSKSLDQVLNCVDAIGLDSEPVPFNSAQVAKYGPKMAECQLAMREAQRELDPAFDSANRLRPDYVGQLYTRQYAYQKTARVCLGLWKMGEISEAIDCFPLLVRLAQLQDIPELSERGGRSDLVRLYVLATDMVVSERLSPLQLQRLERELAGVADIGKRTRLQWDTLLSTQNQWNATRVYPKSQAGRCYEVARFQELLLKYLSVREFLSDERVVLSSTPEYSHLVFERNTDLVWRLGSNLRYEFSARDGFALALRLERFRQQHGAYPERLAAPVTPGLTLNYLRLGQFYRLSIESVNRPNENLPTVLLRVWEAEPGQHRVW